MNWRKTIVPFFYVLSLCVILFSTYIINRVIDYGNRFNLKPAIYYRIYKNGNCYNSYKYISKDDSTCIFDRGSTLQEAEQSIAIDSLKLSIERVR